MKADIIKEAERLRKHLHRYPSLSRQEGKTVEMLLPVLKKNNPDDIITELGGKGFAVVFDSGKKGPVTAFRSELDALPIAEVNNFAYRSVYEGVSHKCGHDGHMAILAGLAAIIGRKRPGKGKVVLLFQPEEETGTGADKILGDEKFSAIKPDYIFALHNLPGFPLKNILIRKGNFCSASVGVKIFLTGKSSHAGEPEKGINPAPAIAEIIQSLDSLNRSGDFSSLALATIIHVRLGREAFGTNPGDAEIYCTLRAFLNDDLSKLQEETENIVKKAVTNGKLKVRIEWTEKFNAFPNDSNGVDLIRQVAKENHLTTTEIPEPFRWSEDFTHFLKDHRGAIFGIGSGTYHPALHNPDYDFPDQIIETGIEMFEGILRKLNNPKP